MSELSKVKRILKIKDNAEAIKPALHIVSNNPAPIKKIKTNSKVVSNWDKISSVLKEADSLKLTRRNNKKILDDIRTFRESS